MNLYSTEVSFPKRIEYKDTLIAYLFEANPHLFISPGSFVALEPRFPQIVYRDRVIISMKKMFAAKAVRPTHVHILRHELNEDFSLRNSANIIL